jgi:hypothetical protein
LHAGGTDADAVTLVGIADPQMQAGGDAVTTAPAKLTGGALEPAPAPGFAGAAVLDGDGRLLGVAVQKPALVAGTANAPQAALVPAAKLRSFLDANYVPPSAGGSGLAGAKSATARVICVRK